MKRYKLYCGDAAATLGKYVPDAAVQLTVTSPPYDGLRAYNGYKFDFAAVARELTRVTAPGGVIVWVVGDQTKDGSESGTSFRQALYFKDECGLNIHDTMIYSRCAMPNQAPRYSQDFELMFVLPRGIPGVFNSLTVHCTYAGVGTSPTSRGEDGTLSGKGRRTIKDTKKRSNIWHYSAGKGKSATDAIAYKHPAIFPEQLATDHILSWSNPGDLVLDPMCGSGTTGKMALLAKRRFIGIDCSAEYIELSKNRIAGVR